MTSSASYISVMASTCNSIQHSSLDSNVPYSYYFRLECSKSTYYFKTAFYCSPFQIHLVPIREPPFIIMLTTSGYTFFHQITSCTLYKSQENIEVFLNRHSSCIYLA